MSLTDTYRTALAVAIDEMVSLLDDAQGCIGNHELPFAIIGLLAEYDQRSENLKAALRLYTDAMRRTK